MLASSLFATEESLNNKIVYVTKKTLQNNVKITETNADGIEYILQTVDVYKGLKAYNFKLKPYGLLNFFNKRTLSVSSLIKEKPEYNSVLKPILKSEEVVSIFLTSQNIDDEPNLIIVVFDHHLAHGTKGQ